MAEIEEVVSKPPSEDVEKPKLDSTNCSDGLYKQCSLIGA